ncbi:unnamed protein product [Kluyveromyces dobzhanskii CBS 2104]|uniref:WGS project CCBQ000000000 data, contig 00058 n=1 Tax=Kluyveromyces dobzhanskii CBS 2104 TaxID=1427455 RepID=A0A0A8LDL7_9SACH|nr:unnamed protein product [Kluyveromyces dobzhanskii CBS 2104]
MVDDSYYITPHETALAVVATSMKKARLRFDTLVINSLMGGILFCAGGLLYVVARAENPLLFEQNPGMTNFLGAFTFSIGLFYVIINGADLFNSNVLFFSVGILRGAVSIYDLLVSWTISWLGNIAGTLFVCYVICHLSGATTSELIVAGSISVAEGKAKASFIETFIKGVAGNFYVCLAVYLQLMCKPIHVKYIVMTVPIFTFVALGFTHVVADMSMLMVGMLNGANVSVGTYIWKLLIPGTLGNIVGGSFFGAVIPYYLHLRVVERDRKQLSLPEFEARDEQPELNMDSRVVRVDPKETAEVEDDTDMDSDDEKYGLLSEKQSYTSTDPSANNNQVLPYRGNPQNSDETGSQVIPYEDVQHDQRDLSRVNTTATMGSLRSHGSRLRSPPGVFPVRGMGKPLTRERTIVDSLYSSDSHQSNKKPPSVSNSFDMISMRSDVDSNLENPIGPHNTNPNIPAVQERRNSILRTLSQMPTVSSNALHHRKSHGDEEYKKEVEEYEREGHYNIEDHKLGSKLEKALSRITTPKLNQDAPDTLPRTTQDVFPEQKPTEEVDPMDRRKSGTTMAGLFRTISKQLVPSKQPSDVNEIHRRLSEAGITTKAAHASDNIAGIENYEGIELPSHSVYYRKRPSSLATNSSSNSLYTLGSINRNKLNPSGMHSGNASTPTGRGGGLSVAGKRPFNPMKNLAHFDNDNFEEQSVTDLH